MWRSCSCSSARPSAHEERSMNEIKLPPLPNLPDRDGSEEICLAGRFVEMDMFRPSTVTGYAREYACRCAEAARKEEREACESLAREMFNRSADADEIADAIRARGECTAARSAPKQTLDDFIRAAEDIKRRDPNARTFTMTPAEWS